jgi:hypothetical protein
MEGPFRPAGIPGLRQEPGHLPDRLAGQAGIRQARRRHRAGRAVAAQAQGQGFLSTKSQAYIKPEVIDLARSAEKIAGREDAAKWGIKDVDRYWAGDKV